MQKTEERIVTAQWMLERQLQWIAQAEVKVAAIVTINIGMLGGLAAAYAAAEAHTHWASFFCIGASFLQTLALLFSALCLTPRLRAPHASLLFFGQVAAMKVEEYIAAASNRSSEQLLTDWLLQIHRNAEIARDKHVWARKATMVSFASAPFWIVAVGMLVKV